MKIPFLRIDPDDTQRAAAASLAQTQDKIADLERARADALLTDNYVGAVDLIDVQLAAQRRAVMVHRERIDAIAQKRRSDERASLEREKAKRIADTAKRLANLYLTAKQADEATAVLQTAVQNLDRADVAVFGEIPTYLSARSIAALANRAAGPGDQLGINEARRVVGPLRRIANGPPYRLAEEVEERGRRLIEFMESEPIPEIEPADEQATAQGEASA